MAHILFLVHGMGKHHEQGRPNAWHEEIVSTLNAAAAQYPNWTTNGVVRRPIEERRRIVPITYDDIFEDQRNDWAQSAATVINFIKANPSRAPGGQLGDAEARQILRLQQATSADTFFNTHVLDVLLYRFTFRGDQVRARVARKILTELKRDRNSGQHTYSILAHSLGTAVIHDTLHALRTHHHNEAAGFPRVTTALKQAVHLFTVANVSRVLQNPSRTPPAYLSEVKPGSAAKGACKYMYTATHDFDPIARTKEFDPTPDAWLNDQVSVRRTINGRKVDFPRYHQTRIRTVTDPNTHAWTHYLANPHVHRHILNSMTTTQIEETDPAFREAVRRHKTPQAISDAQDMLDAIERLSIREPASFQEVYGAWLKFGESGEALRRTIAGLAQ